MSSSIKNNRVTIYFSARKDKDLVIEVEGIEAGDVGWFIKELMRDGIKYRKGVNAFNVTPVGHNFTDIPTRVNFANNKPSAGVAFDSLLDIDAIKKELSDEDAEDLFDKL